MKKYKFEKFVNGKNRKGFINITNNRIYFAIDIYEFLGKPRRINIYTDKLNNAIKIEPDENGTILVSPPRQTSAKGLKMPSGRYYMKENYIFVKE